jgi:hypothetical protein
LPEDEPESELLDDESEFADPKSLPCAAPTPSAAAVLIAAA